MKYLDNKTFDQIDTSICVEFFLKFENFFFTKNKISVFANKLFQLQIWHVSHRRLR